MRKHRGKENAPARHPRPGSAFLAKKERPCEASATRIGVFGENKNAPARHPRPGSAVWAEKNAWGRPDSGWIFRFFFFPEMSQKCPLGPQGPWGTIFRYFPPIFGASEGALWGPWGPLFSLSWAAVAVDNSRDSRDERSSTQYRPQGSPKPCGHKLRETALK